MTGLSISGQKGRRTEHVPMSNKFLSKNFHDLYIGEHVHFHDLYMGEHVHLTYSL